jgi:hypothetical protein
MNVYNVYVGEDMIIHECREEDLEHKLVFVREYFDWYKDDDLRNEMLKIVKIDTSK